MELSARIEAGEFDDLRAESRRRHAEKLRRAGKPVPPVLLKHLEESAVA